MNAGESRSTVYRKRAQDLLDLANTLSAPLRDEMLRVSLIWTRLADDAAEEERRGQQPAGSEIGADSRL